MCTEKNDFLCISCFFFGIHKHLFYSSEKFHLQEKIKDSLAWAFQNDSQLLPIFNYHLQKLHQHGVLDRMKHKLIGDHNRDTDVSKIQNINGLGYDNVAFPFLALLAGLCAAFMQLAIEAAFLCKKKCYDQELESKEDEYASEEAKEIVGGIHDLLLENHRKLGGIKFLYKMKMLSTHPDARL